MRLEEIKEFVLNCGSNHTGVFGGRFEGGYELQQDPDEISGLLYDFQDKYINNFIEIGVAAGGNTRIFSDFLIIQNIFTIDMDIHASINSIRNPNARENNFKNSKYTGVMNHYYGDSHSNECSEWIKAQNVLFDMAFIDGDHSEEGIDRDTKMLLPYLNNGAYLFYHDITTVDGPRRFNSKLRNGLIPYISHEKDYLSPTIFKKGISSYKYVK